MTPEQLQLGEELAAKAFAEDKKGNFPGAEAYWTELIERFPSNPATWSNRGNSRVSQNKLEEAIADFNQSIELAPNATDPYLNRGVAYEGLRRYEEVDTQIRIMRNLLRKYPMFPDIRAALTAVLWEMGKQGEAESNWVAAVGLDNRYQDLEWVANTRRWPPEMVAALSKFLNLEP